VIWEQDYRRKPMHNIDFELRLGKLLPALNEILRIKGSRSSHSWNSLKKKAEALIRKRIKEGTVAPNPPYVLKVHWLEPNMARDPDNIAAGVKLICDALVGAGVIEDDGWRQIREINHSFSVVDVDEVGFIVQLVPFVGPPLPKRGKKAPKSKYIHSAGRSARKAPKGGRQRRVL